MFLLNGSSINIYAPYTTAEGVTYPHLRDAGIRAELGVTEVPDPVRADDRFYWDGDINNPKMLEDRLEVKEDGSPLWEQTYDPATESMVDTDVQVVTRGLKYTWTQQVKQTANSMLAQTDWYVVRKSEKNVDIPADIVTKRDAIRTECNRLETAITACTDVAALIAVVGSQNFPSDGIV
jgi:hypothetical protein